MPDMFAGISDFMDDTIMVTRKQLLAAEGLTIIELEKAHPELSKFREDIIEALGNMNTYLYHPEIIPPGLSMLAVLADEMTKEEEENG